MRFELELKHRQTKLVQDYLFENQLDVNKVMHAVSKGLPSKPKITSHSFRIGYISQLWKATKDIEFVRQTIGHRRLDSTSGYVNQMTNEERQNRISAIKEG